MRNLLEDQFQNQPVDKKKLERIAQTLQKNTKEATFTGLKEAISNDLVEQKMFRTFTTEPIDELLVWYAMDEIKLNFREASELDLTSWVKMDHYYRWINGGDIAINVTGRPNKGKSNIGLDLDLDWATITQVPLYMSNIVQYLPLFNLLLKGYKVKDTGKGIDISQFELKRGLSFTLDEGSDQEAVGFYGQTVHSETGDLEGRYRKLQIARITCGTRMIQHQAYYNILAYERNPYEKICKGIVYTKLSNDSISTPFYLGSVTIPYVRDDVFQAYNKSAVASVKGYGTGEAVNIISKMRMQFAMELRENEEYQALPTKPPTERMMWIQSNPRYSIFKTNQHFKTLEELSRRPAGESQIPQPIQHHQLDQISENKTISRDDIPKPPRRFRK